MIRACCSKPFLSDPSQTLWLALAGRNSGTRPSDLAGITCENAALDFDITCAFRLELHDAEVRKTQAKLIAYEVSKIFGDGSETTDDVEDGDVEVW